MIAKFMRQALALLLIFFTLHTVTTHIHATTDVLSDSEREHIRTTSRPTDASPAKKFPTEQWTESPRIQTHDMLSAIHQACRSHLELMLNSETADYTTIRSQLPSNPKVLDFTYMAADNDLYLFALTNLEQKKRIGSNENLVIFVDLHMSRPHTRKISKRLIIHKNKVVQVSPDDLCLDSGSGDTFLQGLSAAHALFPHAEQVYVDFWNHGSGDVNPILKTAVNPFKLFHYNPETKLIELDRSIGFLDYVCTIAQEESCRGICFDDSTGKYLDDQKLMYALDSFCKKRGKKIDVVTFDACLMAGTGTAWIMHHFADYMVASEEVVLGPGYNYTLLHQRISQHPLPSREYAVHAVKCFEKTYSPITNDFTHSAIDLNRYRELSDNIDHIARIFIDGLRHQKNNSVKRTIQKCASRNFCTSFNEPSYKDLHHFCSNLLIALPNIELVADHDTPTYRQYLEAALKTTLRSIENIVFISVSGKNVSKARGISIYIPEREMHSSYPATEFAKNNSWVDFLSYYLTISRNDESYTQD